MPRDSDVNLTQNFTTTDQLDHECNTERSDWRAQYGFTDKLITALWLNPTLTELPEFNKSNYCLSTDPQPQSSILWESLTQMQSLLR
jgi:hypothetical protein